MDIRRAKKDDALKIVALFKRNYQRYTYGEFMNAKELQSILSSNKYVSFIAEHKDVIVGHSGISIRDNDAKFSNLLVDNEFRGRNIGSFLENARMNFVKGLGGINVVYSSCVSDDNKSQILKSNRNFFPVSVRLAYRKSFNNDRIFSHSILYLSDLRKAVRDSCMEVFVPKSCRDIITKIYGNFKCKRFFRHKQKNRKTAAVKTGWEIAFDEETKRLIAKNVMFGKSLDKIINIINEHFEKESIFHAIFHVNLTKDDAYEIIKRVVSEGFFFAGIIPCYSYSCDSRIDIMEFQRISKRIIIDDNAACFYDQLAFELFEKNLAQYHSKTKM
ncbi:anti-sigma regulatory factor [Candidatus Magnetomorum sp. HK-1]|nr:anti-sigma regulatory factor [Candidatus Magnetomorum sp. HK-1]